MTCGIYKIENKLNGKVYIGQSINIEERWKQHKRNYSFLTSNFYKAIQEFGINNFNWFIIEECNKKELNEKEKYWINFYDSINNGYNMKIGGSYHKKLTDEQLNFIIEDLIKNELTIKEISKEYNVTTTYIYEINRGERNKQNNRIYPLRKLNWENKNSLNGDEIIKDLQNLSLSIKDIIDKYNICENTIRRINKGEIHYRDNIEYPIRKINNLLEKEVEEIIELLKNSNYTIQAIADQFNKSRSAIVNINIGKTFYNKDIIYPIRKNKNHELSEEEINEIVNLLINNKITIYKIANKFQVSYNTIKKIKNGELYKNNNLIYPLR